MAENKLVADAGIVFDLNGQRKTLRFRALPLAAWSELYDQLGMEPATLVQRMQNGSPIVAAAVIWLERKQRERRLTWPEAQRDIERDDVEFSIVDVIIAGQSWMGTEATEVEAADPLASEGS